MSLYLFYCVFWLSDIGLQLTLLLFRTVHSVMIIYSTTNVMLFHLFWCVLLFPSKTLVENSKDIQLNSYFVLDVHQNKFHSVH